MLHVGIWLMSGCLLSIWMRRALSCVLCISVIMDMIAVLNYVFNGRIEIGVILEIFVVFHYLLVCLNYLCVDKLCNPF